MAVSRVAALLLCAIAAPSLASRPNQGHILTAESRGSVESFVEAGAVLTTDCQDYPVESGDDFGVGDTVRIFRPGSAQHNHVGLVAHKRQDGMSCLAGLKGCYNSGELKPVNTLVFTFHTLGGAVGQIFAAITDDVEDAWEAIKLSLSTFASAVASRITDFRATIALQLGVCEEFQGEVAMKEFDKVAVMSKSRLAILVDSAVERWGNVLEGVQSVAEATQAKLVKIATYLSEKLSDFYDAHLKDIVEALKRYLGGIADAVAEVPDELKPLARGEDSASMLEVRGEPEGLSKDIEGFVDKVGELGAKIMELSPAVYDTVAAGLGVLMSGAGRLIAAASSLYGKIKTFVQGLASAAVARVQEWGRSAMDFACNFDMKKTAQAAWASVQEGFGRAMDAVHRGYTFVKQNLADVADSLSAMVASAAATIKSKTLAVWESDAVQALLARIQEELKVLKDLIVQSASLAAQFVGGFRRYLNRFIPQRVKDKFKTAAHKARELAKQIQEQIAELIKKLTHGETETLEVDANSITAEP